MHFIALELSWVSAVGSGIKHGPELLIILLNIHLPLQCVFTSVRLVHLNSEQSFILFIIDVG